MFLGIFPSDPTLPADAWSELFPDTDRIEVEIGTGDGGFLEEAARAEPRTALLGIERRERFVNHIQNDRQLPANAKILHSDAKWVTENLIAPASIDAFHVYFPDPWWKKRHHKRRMFDPAFSQAVRRCLKPDGALYLMTDVAMLFQVMADEILQAGFEQEAWSRDPTAPAQSSYERKYRIQGRRFHEARFRPTGD